MNTDSSVELKSALTLARNCVLLGDPYPINS